MNAHIHLGLAEAAIIFAVVLILGTGWRYVAARVGDTPTGRAMLFAY